MIFTEIKPQMEQLSHDEMVKALAFLRSRLRADTAANREELAQYRFELPSVDEQVAISALARVIRDRLDSERAYLRGLKDTREALATGLFCGKVRLLSEGVVDAS